MKLALALAALAFGSFARADERLKDLERDLNGDNDKKRRAAVIELAKLDTLEAWKLVIGALDDPLPQVADEAQLQIAAIDDDKACEVLLGKEGLKSKDTLVRARVVEAFGRMGARPSNEPLIAGLEDKDASVRRTAAWSIERLQQDARKAKGELSDHAELIDFLDLRTALIKAWGREKDDETCAAMLLVDNLLSGTPQSPPPPGLATDKRACVRSVALMLAQTRDEVLALPVVHQLANDADLGVRLNAIDTCALLKSKPAVLELVAQLERETALRARWRIVETLRTLSGLAHRLDAAPWRAWADALPNDWKGEAVEAKKTDDSGSTVTFHGLPILSERVCFVIDLSGSVWQAGKDGKTKKQILDDELKKALNALPPTTEFNLIPYTSKPIPWQPKLVPASEKNVAAALEFFEKRKDTGTGNFWDAYLLALEDPAVDTIVNLSDGAPTGGVRWNLGLMRELMREKNRFRRVALDAVLTDAANALVVHWKGMCADSGGRLIEVELK